jgi:NTE family protein
VWFRRRRHRINLALQGGGAHGAFTWGVLDRLLEQEDLDLGWVSATSAGAVNAVALAAGLANGGPPAARAKLKAIWEAVVQAGMPELIRMNPFLYGLSRSSAMAQVASIWSPYEFNPLRFDPLRQLLSKHIDFDKLRSADTVELLIAATVVATGETRLFRRREMSVEAVLASACLPTLHHAVQIDGVAYWDGGFSANPDLVTLALESPVRDTLIVQLNPTSKQGLPTQTRDINEHVNRLTFNAPFLRDIRLIETVRETAQGRWRTGGGRLKPLLLHRFHLVEAGRYTATLGPDTKIKPDAGLFTYLHGAGRTEAHKWLSRHKNDIGKRETIDLTQRYLRPPPEARVAQPEAQTAASPPPQSKAESS